MKNRFVIPILIGLLSSSLVAVTLVAAGVAQVKAQTQAIHPSYLYPIARSHNPDSGSPAKLSTGRQLKISLPPTGTHEISRFELWIDSSGWARLSGVVTPAVTVTVWLPHEPFSMTSTPDTSCPGCFGFPGFTSLLPGDVLSATPGGGDPPLTIHVPDPLDAHADSQTGYQVWGQIGGWYTREVEVHHSGGYLLATVTTDGAGNFTSNQTGKLRGEPGYIRFVELVDSTDVVFDRPFADLEPQIRVNYDGDEIEGDYDAGHTLWLTVTNATGEIKAVISGTTGPIDTWGGWSGWVTNVNIPWNGLPPDIQPYDYVYVRVDNGRTGVVRLPAINGSANEAVDTVSGNLVGNWLTGTVYVGCAIWWPGGPGMGTSAAPPDYHFSCDFAGSFDILPGMMVGVDYREADNDQVFNVIWSSNHLWLPVIYKP